MILYFKKNFKLSCGGNELSYDYYNKRQAPCLGASLVFKNDNETVTEYVNFFTDIVNHDYLFASYVLVELILYLNHRFTNMSLYFRVHQFFIENLL